MDFNILLLLEQPLNQLYITLGIALASAVLLIWVIMLTISHSRLRKRYQLFMQGDNAKNLEGILMDCMAAAKEQNRTTISLERQLTELIELSKTNLRNIGVVRFCAFTEVGSDLSFAIALTDDSGRGVVISSLFGREDNRIYAKPLENGKSTYRLSAEEEQAIRKAMGK